MGFEMSLPHAPRIQAVAGDGTESLAADEQQWELYNTVQQALQQQEAEASGEEAEAAAAEGEEGGKPSSKAPQPSDPQKVLEKLLTARGELDVIADLITFVEQQQFLAVEGIHRHPPSLQERVRARALRLAASQAQLRGACALLQRGLTSLQAQARVDGRFLADLAQLRQRWKLRRHSGAAGLFYADLTLPLRGSAAEGITQEGAHASLLMDTNGDACIVEAAAPGGRRRAVRGWQAIHAALELRQQLLAWRVLQQMLEAQARRPEHEADADGAVATVQRMAAAALEACQAALYRTVADSGSSSSGLAADMDVDAPSGRGGGGGAPLQAAPEAAPEAAAAAGAAAAAAAALPSGMASSAALDIQAVLSLPGFQQRFEARALLLLSSLMIGGAGGRGSGLAAAGGPQQQQHGEGGVLEKALRWLRHSALRHRINGALQRWSAGGAGRAMQPVDTREEFASAWQLAPSGAVVVVQGDRLHVEDVPVATPAAGRQGAMQRGLSKAEFDRLLLVI